MNSHIAPEQTKVLSLDTPIGGGTGRDLRAVADAAADGVPYAFVALFETIETLRVPGCSFVIQFVAAHQGAGTSTVAAGFATAAALSYRRPVLLVEAGADQHADGPVSRKGRSRPLRQSRLRESQPPESHAQSTATPHLFRTATIGPEFAPGALTLEDRIAQLRRDYHAVVIDCPSLGSTRSAITLARHCDGTALVAAAAKSSARAMTDARDDIARVGGQVLGVVFNRERSYRPTLPSLRAIDLRPPDLGRFLQLLPGRTVADRDS